MLGTLRHTIVSEVCEIATDSTSVSKHSDTVAIAATLVFEKPTISTAVEADISAIAAIHVDAFDGFFLTSMGSLFLREMYRGFLLRKDAVLLVAREDGQVVGFVCGSTRPSAFFSSLFKARWWAFAAKAIPAVARNPTPVLRKLWAAAFYRGDTPPSIVRGALLSSIAVASSSQGKSVADRLLNAFEAVAQQCGCEVVYLTTDSEENERANAFYKKNAYTVDIEFLQCPHRRMNRYIKSLTR